jgi:hypothetical protein
LTTPFFIIGSDEFLVRAIKQIEQHVSLTNCPRHPPPNGDEQDIDEEDQRQVPLDKIENSSTPLQDKPLYPSSTQL